MASIPYLKKGDSSIYVDQFLAKEEIPVLPVAPKVEEAKEESSPSVKGDESYQGCRRWTTSIHQPSIISRNIWPFVSSTHSISSQKTRLSTTIELQLPNCGKLSKIQAFQPRRFFTFYWEKKTNTPLQMRDSRNTAFWRSMRPMTLKLWSRPAYFFNMRLWGK